MAGQQVPPSVEVRVAEVDAMTDEIIELLILAEGVEFTDGLNTISRSPVLAMAVIARLIERISS